MNAALSHRPVKISLFAAATSGSGAWLVSRLPAINLWLSTIVLILTIVAWLLLIAIRLRAWKKKQNDSEEP